MKNSASHVVGSMLYGVVLFVIALATLEGFSGLNADFDILSRGRFHAVMLVLALGVASYEAVTLRGLSGLQNLFERPEPIAIAPAGEYAYRPAYPDDLIRIRKLAVKRYGYAFTMQEIERWYGCNPACFFLMFRDGELVGYVDAFPIAEKDYIHLFKGGVEQMITPLKPEQVDEESSFYIASLVIDEGFGSRILPLITQTLRFYKSKYPYPLNNWTRLCAMGYSQRGRELLTERGMTLANEGEKKPMFSINHTTRLSSLNHRFWKQVFPRALKPTPSPSAERGATFTALLQSRGKNRRLRKGF